MRMMMEGDWRGALTTLKLMDRGAFAKAVKSGVAQEAMLMERYVADGFLNQGLTRPWKKLSQVTLALRKHNKQEGTKILQVSNSLRRSVTAQKTGEYTWFVGVNRKVRTKDGKKLVNIAAVHEGPFPTLIPVTKKMRRFWLALFMQGVVSAPLSSKRTVLVIMPRPFLAPAYEKVAKGTKQRMLDRVQQHMIDNGVIPK